MSVQKHPEEEAVQYFKELAENRENIRNTYQYVTDTVTQALQTEDYDRLFSLIQYIEGLEGTLSYSFTGRSQRILKYLHIIQLEYKYQCPLFCDGCLDADSLYDKYVTCLFALRRLTFRLSPESIEEAKSFLHANVLSPFAIYTLSSDDRIEATKSFYMQILDLYSNIWSETEIQIFSAFANSGGNT